ncbi:MAG: SWIM zinc finger family protein [Actinomycetota bacterium]|nr:SWIM zinc finger family protein [Actinomycetota bacterium]
MSDRRIAQAPALNTPLAELAAKVERELERLRAKRPALSSRIDRAGSILVQHLACPRQRPIRVRVRDGKPRFLVNGSEGAVYVVDPEAWTCSCPDAHRRGKGCKHSLATYVLWRVSRPAPKLPSCTACGGRFPHAELVEITEDDESLTWFPGDRLCKSCLLECGGIS